MKGTVMYRYLYRSNTGSFYKRNGTSTGTRTVQYWSITDPWQRYRNGNFKGSSVPFRYRSLPFRSVPVPVHCTGVQIPPMVSRAPLLRLSRVSTESRRTVHEFRANIAFSSTVTWVVLKIGEKNRRKGACLQVFPVTSLDSVSVSCNSLIRN